MAGPIDLEQRPDLAEVDRLTTLVIERYNDAMGCDVILIDYPLVWAALIETTEPEDEQELADQAFDCAEALRNRYDLREA